MSVTENKYQFYSRCQLFQKYLEATTKEQKIDRLIFASFSMRNWGQNYLVVVEIEKKFPYFLFWFLRKITE